MLDMFINWRFAAKAAAWGLSMLAVLQLRHLSGSWSHALCGPWGCGPTLESVVTCHAAWIVLLVPAVMAITRRMQREAVALCGGVAMSVAVLGLIGVAVWLAIAWYPDAASMQRPYVVQKYLYTVACLIDVPLVQLLLAGAVLRIYGRSDAPDVGRVMASDE